MARCAPTRWSSGTGERYDAILQAGGDGVARIVAAAPDAPVRMPTRMLSHGDLQSTETDGSAGSGDARRLVRLDLAMRRAGYVWTIGGQAFPEADPIRVRRGEHVRFVMRNRTMMPHPMHLRHVFSVCGVGGPVKDTALALPMRELALDWTADRPGSRAHHCHNVHHQEAGMMRRVELTQRDWISARPARRHTPSRGRGCRRSFPISDAA